MEAYALAGGLVAGVSCVQLAVGVVAPASGPGTRTANVADAMVRHSPSWTWRSLCQRDMVLMPTLPLRYTLTQRRARGWVPFSPDRNLGSVTKTAPDCGPRA